MTVSWVFPQWFQARVLLTLSLGFQNSSVRVTWPLPRRSGVCPHRSRIWECWRLGFRPSISWGCLHRWALSLEALFSWNSQLYFGFLHELVGIGSGAEAFGFCFSKRVCAWIRRSVHRRCLCETVRRLHSFTDFGMFGFVKFHGKKGLKIS